MADKTLLTIKFDKELTPSQIAEMMETYNRWAPSRGLPIMESITLVKGGEDLTILNTVGDGNNAKSIY